MVLQRGGGGSGGGYSQGRRGGYSDYGGREDNGRHRQDRPRGDSWQGRGGGGGGGDGFRSGPRGGGPPSRQRGGGEDWGARGGGNRMERGGGGPRRDRGGDRRDHGDGRGPWSHHSGRGDRGNGEGASEGRPATSYLEENAAALHKMKRDLKNSKSFKERRDLVTSARRLVRRTRIDPSTQDEKSVTLLLNCAAMFSCSPNTVAVRQAVDWMTSNINDLSRQNVALFANAVASLQVEDYQRVLLECLSPAVEKHIAEFRPVELAMTLQAYVRGKVTGNEKLQDALVAAALAAVPQMPVAQLSTFASALAGGTWKDRDPEKLKSALGTVLTKALADAEKMHSHEVATFVSALAEVPGFYPEELMLALIKRANATISFYPDTEVGMLLQAAVRLKKPDAGASEELLVELATMEKAFLERLSRIARHCFPAAIVTILNSSAELGISLPPEIIEPFVEAIQDDLTFNRPRFSDLLAIIQALTRHKVHCKGLIDAISCYLVGVRPQRPGRDAPPENEDSGLEKEVRMDIYERFFAELVSLRIALEDFLNAIGEKANESLAKTLPERLAACSERSTPTALTRAALAVCLAPSGNPLRNTKNDDMILQTTALCFREVPKNILKKEISVELREQFASAAADPSSRGAELASFLKSL